MKERHNKQTTPAALATVLQGERNAIPTTTMHNPFNSMRKSCTKCLWPEVVILGTEHIVCEFLSQLKLNMYIVTEHFSLLLFTLKMLSVISEGWWLGGYYSKLASPGTMKFSPQMHE